MFFSLLLAVPLPASGLQRESARPGGPMRAGDALASVVHRTKSPRRSCGAGQSSMYAHPKGDEL
jgi:hypothetical protein